MSSRRSRRRRIVVGIVLAALLALGSYAFTAANTVPGTTAGSGSGTISGYTITNVQYNLNAATPTNIDSVSFTISPSAATTVKVQLVTGGSWFSCTNTSGSVSCNTTGVTAAAADNLTVVAAQ